MRVSATTRHLLANAHSPSRFFSSVEEQERVLSILSSIKFTRQTLEAGLNTPGLSARCCARHNSGTMGSVGTKACSRADCCAGIVVDELVWRFRIRRAGDKNRQRGGAQRFPLTQDCVHLPICTACKHISRLPCQPLALARLSPLQFPCSCHACQCNTMAAAVDPRRRVGGGLCPRGLEQPSVRQWTRCW